MCGSVREALHAVHEYAVVIPDLDEPVDGVSSVSSGVRADLVVLGSTHLLYDEGGESFLLPDAIVMASSVGTFHVLGHVPVHPVDGSLVARVLAILGQVPYTVVVLPVDVPFNAEEVHLLSRGEDEESVIRWSESIFQILNRSTEVWVRERDR